MISKETFTIDHINEIREKEKVDPILLERSIYALGLLEALARVGMPFIFKGGTCLMLLLEKPRRLSTDIDIIVEPGTDIKKYIKEASKIFPFISVEQQERTGRNNITKSHYKFSYASPVSGKPFHILLDVLFEQNHYETLIKKKIETEIVITEEPYIEISMPSIDCILGDKLTAFAPHTTGIPFGVDKELEIIKQMYDVAVLFDEFEKFNDVVNTYYSTVSSEIQYRGSNITAKEALMDTIEASACIVGRGKYNDQEYPLFLSGIRKLVNHVYGERFSGEIASRMACKVMYLAATVMNNLTFERIENPEEYIETNIGNSRYAKLSYMRKLDAESFAYIVKTIEAIEN